MSSSRLPGFYKLGVAERRRIAATVLGIDESALARALSNGGLDLERADKTIENVIGTYALPFAVGLNVQMNGHDHLVPMVVEEPSVVAATSNAARLIRAGGGFVAEADDAVMTAQVQLDQVPDVDAARKAIARHRTELLSLANEVVAGVVARGGGARDLEVRDLGDGWLVVHIYVDCCDAMGANLVNSVAEATAPRIAELTRGRPGLRILSNLSDRRCVRVTAQVPLNELVCNGWSAHEVRDAVVRASEFAERDPYRAVTHNKGIMNGVDAVTLATGNDWRAVEAGAHAFAARSGVYRPLSNWSVGSGGALLGSLEMPLALGIVGGPSRSHEGVKLALTMSGARSARDLAMLAACAGLAANLAALRALATDGIQRGHMALHARSVAMAAGARGIDVEKVALAIHEKGQVTLEAARTVLRVLTGPLPELHLGK